MRFGLVPKQARMRLFRALNPSGAFHKGPSPREVISLRLTPKRARCTRLDRKLLRYFRSALVFGLVVSLALLLPTTTDARRNGRPALYRLAIAPVLDGGNAKQAAAELTAVLEALRAASINVQEIENVIFDGAAAASARLRLDAEPDLATIAAVEASSEHVLAVTLRSIS